MYAKKLEEIERSLVDTALLVSDSSYTVHVHAGQENIENENCRRKLPLALNMRSKKNLRIGLFFKRLKTFLSALREVTYTSTYYHFLPL